MNTLHLLPELLPWPVLRRTLLVMASRTRRGRRAVRWSPRWVALSWLWQGLRGSRATRPVAGLCICDRVLDGAAVSVRADCKAHRWCYEIDLDEPVEG